jgi:hypothetical protein
LNGPAQRDHLKEALFFNPNTYVAFRWDLTLDFRRELTGLASRDFLR